MNRPYLLQQARRRVRRSLRGKQCRAALRWYCQLCRVCLG